MKRAFGSFLSVLIGAPSVAITVFLLFAAAAPAQTTKPNIVFIIADDMSFAHSSFAGDPVVKTPTLDRVAREGVYFNNAHVVASSCTPSRASVLTGRPIWQLEEGAQLWGTLPRKFKVYPNLLEKAGYKIGFTGKGWDPGDFRPGGRTRNPCGPRFENFDAFLAEAKADEPICYWFGSRNPHRPYATGSGIASGTDAAKINVPPMLPDVPGIRSDIADYLKEVQEFDREAGTVVAALEKAGRLDNTLIVMTSDNGMPFPRAKSTLYNFGTHMPLAMRWPGRIKPGRTVDDFVSHIDIAPTFLEAAGVEVPKEMVGKSLLPLLTAEGSGRLDPARDHIYLGNERHSNARPNGQGYPRRAVRTADFLYIHNYEPDRWPAGDPPGYADTDPARTTPGIGPSKDFVLAHRDDPQFKRYYEQAFAKRGAEELYDLKKDPAEMINVADDANYAETKQKLRAQLDAHLKETGDPRSTGQPAPFDSYPYYGNGAGTRPAARAFDKYLLDYDTPVDPDLQKKIEALDASLRETFDMKPEQTAVGLLDLNTLRLALVRPDEINYAASVPKVGILLAYFQLHPEAATSLDPQTKHELGLMAKASSNEMASKFSHEMTLKKVQEVINAYGLYDEKRGGGIWVGKHYGKDSEKYPDPVGKHSHAATVRQLLRFWLLLEQRNLVSPEASMRMREIFASPDIPHDDIKFVKGLKGREVEIVRKWGSWENWLLDTAIITGGGRHYILVAMTEHPKGDAYLEALAPAVDDLLK